MFEVALLVSDNPLSLERHTKSSNFSSLASIMEFVPFQRFVAAPLPEDRDGSSGSGQCGAVPEYKHSRFEYYVMLLRYIVLLSGGGGGPVFSGELLDLAIKVSGD